MPRLEKRQDLVVFVQYHDSATCAECGAELLKGSLARFQREKGVICLECSDLDHLEFLPSGDAAITRRSTKYSNLWAIVLKFSRSRRRNERQGILAETEAIDRAIAESEADSEERERRREREAVRRESLDREYEPSLRMPFANSFQAFLRVGHPDRGTRLLKAQRTGGPVGSRQSVRTSHCVPCSASPRASRAYRLRSVAVQVRRQAACA